MSTPPSDINAWLSPPDLTPAEFPAVKVTPAAEDRPQGRGPAQAVRVPQPTESNEERLSRPAEATNARENSTLDPKLLLSLLGPQLAEQNPAMSPLLGLLNGEKPDMLSLLPLLMQLNTKKPEPQKETPPKEGVTKTINLNDYSII